VQSTIITGPPLSISAHLTADPPANPWRRAVWETLGLGSDNPADLCAAYPHRASAARLPDSVSHGT